MTYDPLMRLKALSGGINLHRLYDGDELIAEYNNNGALLRRFVHGPGIDEPLVWYAVGGARRFLHADERGSIVAATSYAYDGSTGFWRRAVPSFPPRGLLFVESRHVEV